MRGAGSPHPGELVACAVLPSPTLRPSTRGLPVRPTLRGSADSKRARAFAGHDATAPNRGESPALPPFRLPPLAHRPGLPTPVGAHRHGPETQSVALRAGALHWLLRSPALPWHERRSWSQGRSRPQFLRGACRRLRLHWWELSVACSSSVTLSPNAALSCKGMDAFDSFNAG